MCCNLSREVHVLFHRSLAKPYNSGHYPFLITKPTSSSIVSGLQSSRKSSGQVHLYIHFCQKIQQVLQRCRKCDSMTQKGSHPVPDMNIWINQSLLHICFLTNAVQGTVGCMSQVITHEVEIFYSVFNFIKYLI